MRRSALLLAAVALAAGCSVIVDPGKLEPAAPARPAGLAATPGDARVTLAWDPYPGDVVEFRVDYGTSPDALTLRTVAPAGATSVQVAPLTNGTTYWFTVAAVDSAGNVSAPSDPASATAGGAVGAAPSVVGTVPVAGAGGVSTTAPIQITFSEAMDVATVEAAFSSSPTIACTWTWSVGNTVATCAHAPLTPLLLTSIALATTAKDTTGTPLASPWSINFTTAAAPANHGTLTIYSVATLDGVVWSTPQVVANNSSLYAGDNDLGAYGRAFLSFDIGGLPANVTAITSATLGVYQETGANLGAPYTDLGLLHAERVEYGPALDTSDLELAALDGADYVLSGDDTEGWKIVEVGPSAAAAWSARATLGNRTQFRIRFATNTDGDGAGDTARFSAGEGANRPYLEIHYDYP